MFRGPCAGSPYPDSESLNLRFDAVLGLDFIRAQLVLRPRRVHPCWRMGLWYLVGSLCAEVVSLLRGFAGAGIEVNLAARLEQGIVGLL